MTMPTDLEVLLIEDEKMDRDLVQELVALRGRGRMHVTEAGDLQSGLDLLGARPFDLVLLDTRLPDVSALSALRAVGDLAPDTPILPHPAFLTVEMRHAARQRGPWDVVERGELDRMWAAMSNLLATGRDETAAGRRQSA
ncbi:MAG TPA: response regulator [Gemmatimonadales bacterium]|nr:response regulator [Gemmatimonadales bacterium]